MSESKLRGRWLVWAVVLLILLPVLYTMSYGPALWLTFRGWMDPETLSVLYRPLFLVEEYLTGPLGWYYELWVP